MTTMTNGQAGLVNSAQGAAGALAGWAIASLGKQLPAGQVHTMLSATANGSAKPSAAPSVAPSTRVSMSSDTHKSRSSSPSVPSRSAFGDTARASSPAPGPSRLGKTTIPASRTTTGMQLGSKSISKPGASFLVDALAGEFEEDGDEVAAAWGHDDLMDAKADDDDWGK